MDVVRNFADNKPIQQVTNWPSVYHVGSDRYLSDFILWRGPNSAPAINKYLSDITSASACFSISDHADDMYFSGF